MATENLNFQLSIKIIDCLYKKSDAIKNNSKITSQILVKFKWGHVEKNR